MNTITRKELVEQYGSLKLTFEFFSGNHFVFNGKDKHGTEVCMFVFAGLIAFTSEQSIVYIDDFIEYSDEFVTFLIFNKDLDIIYQD